MKSALRILPLAAALIFAACDEGSVLEPDGVDPNLRRGPGPAVHAVSVMTWNMYVGADVDAVIAALLSPDPSDDQPALLAAIGTLQETDAAARINAIARRIARTRPHVVGLQEVSEINIDLTALGLLVVIDLDFAALLQASLAALGANCTLAASVQNIDVFPFPGVRLVDYDAMLVDANRVQVSSAHGQTFANNIGVVAPGVEIKRGWVSVEGTVHGQSYTFVSTHLESGPGEPLSLLRATQATEIVTAIGDRDRAVVMGDLNDGPDSPMHGVLSGAGFADAWTASRPHARGLTCCHDTDLSNRRPMFDQRLDYVFARGIGNPIARHRGRIVRLGIRPSERIEGPVHAIWPSDHAGLLARLFPSRADLLTRDDHD